MPVLPFKDSPKFGLGLWNSIPVTMTIEIAPFIIGVSAYSKITQRKNRSSDVGLCMFVAFLLLIYFGSIFGPPPPNENAIAILGASTLAIFTWPHWIEKQREYILKRGATDLVF